MGTRVVTGNAACGGGDKGAEAGAGAGARGTASGSRGAGRRGGPPAIAGKRLGNLKQGHRPPRPIAYGGGEVPLGAYVCAQLAGHPATSPQSPGCSVS